MIKQQLEIKPLNGSFHSSSNFREQLCVLYPDGIWIDGDGFQYVKMIKSLVAVCKPGLASFDPDNPGADSLKSWTILDDFVEKHGVRGFYHTHPPGIKEFSGLDERFQTTIAQANGKRCIWHVVQACGELDARVVCFNMINGNLVIKYDFGFIEMKPSDFVLLLPLPYRIDKENGYHTIKVDN